MKILIFRIVGIFLLLSLLTVARGRILQEDGCIQFDENYNCTKCIFKYVLSEGQCIKVNDLCKTWDNQTAYCTSCYGGYTLQDGVCEVKSGGTDGEGNCPPRQVQVEGKCVAVSDLCQTWNNNGFCTSCYGGYTLYNGVCRPQGNEGEIICPYRTVKKDGQCIAVNDLCNTWDETSGACTSCYGGYKLADGVCIIDGGSNGNNGNNEAVCPPRTVRRQGKCVAVSDLCSTWNVNGDCTSCYGGYHLSNGLCIADGYVGSDGSDQLDCPYRTVKIDGKCVPVSDQCKTWDDTTAECTSCYQGWNLDDGECTL